MYGGEGATGRGGDMLYEEVAVTHLSRWYGPAVTQPIRMHVAAKSYLYTTSFDDFTALSPVSIASLKVLGGPFTDDGAAAFIEHPFARDAVRLRNWDDRAKGTEARTPALKEFRDESLAAIAESSA